MYSTPPTAQTTGAIESIFWLEVHQADTNGATVAISEFPSQTGDIDHLLISAKVLILAIWSSFFWVLEGNSKIATVAPFIFTLCISSPKISPIAPTILAVGGVLYVSGAPHLVIRLFLYMLRNLCLYACLYAREFRSMRCTVYGTNW